MNWTKLDAALAGALEQTDQNRDARRLPVFVQLDAEASPPDRETLFELGVCGADGQSGTGTANLSHREVEALSEQPWVRRLVLSGQQRLTGR